MTVPTPELSINAWSLLAIIGGISAAVVSIIKAVTDMRVAVLRSIADAAALSVENSKKAGATMLAVIDANEKTSALIGATVETNKKADVLIDATLETNKKADRIINTASQIHELTNSTNSDLRRTIDVMTEKLSSSAERVVGLERLITHLVEQSKAVAASQAISDTRIAEALHTTITEPPKNPQQ